MTTVGTTGVTAVASDGVGTIHGYGTIRVMEDTMDGAGTTHGDGIDGTIGAMEATMD